MQVLAPVSFAVSLRPATTKHQIAQIGPATRKMFATILLMANRYVLTEVSACLRGMASAAVVAVLGAVESCAVVIFESLLFIGAVENAESRSCAKAAQRAVAAKATTANNVKFLSMRKACFMSLPGVP